MKKCTGINAQEYNGSMRRIITPNSFITRPLKGSEKNTILGLWNEQRVWCDTNETIVDTAISYFKNIFTSSQPSPSTIAEVTRLILTKVTEDINMELVKEFYGEEVLSALKQMHPTKAPGPAIICLLLKLTELTSLLFPKPSYLPK